MRATEFLFEASGLRAARPGEIYTDPQGVEYKFINWNWQFPVEANLVQYADSEDLQAGILQATDQDQNKIIWTNKPSARSKSFSYAVFANDEGAELWIGKFYDRKNPNNTITDSEAKAVTGLTAGTAAKGTSAAIKATANLQPGQLGLADNRARNIASIRKVVGQHTQSMMLTSAIDNATSAEDIVFQNGGGLVSALQDDFCEVVAPIAIITGHPVITGPINQAISDVFKTDALDGSVLIKFPVEQNNPLIDSYIISGGIELGVSHKGKSGAKATITNLWKAKEDAARTDTGAAYIAKYPDAVEILDICNVEAGLAQPIVLGVKFQLINSMEAAILKEMMQAPRDPKYQLLGDPKNPNAVVKTPFKQDLAKVPQEMRRLFNMGGYKSGSYVSFLCLARLAKLVADHINTNTKIDFGEAIRSFLNSSAMIQAKSVVAKRGDDAYVRTINIVYPPNFKEKAQIESNGYSGTGAKGKFSFSLPST
jgi:hypothetical protein